MKDKKNKTEKISAAGALHDAPSGSNNGNKDKENNNKPANKNERKDK